MIQHQEALAKKGMMPTETNLSLLEFCFKKLYEFDSIFDTREASTVDGKKQLKFNMFDYMKTFGREFILEPSWKNIKEDVLDSWWYRWGINIILISLACKVPGVSYCIRTLAQQLRYLLLVATEDVLILLRQILWDFVPDPTPISLFGLIQSVGQAGRRILGLA